MLYVSKELRLVKTDAGIQLSCKPPKDSTPISDMSEVSGCIGGYRDLVYLYYELMLRQVAMIFGSFFLGMLGLASRLFGHIILGNLCVSIGIVGLAMQAILLPSGKLLDCVGNVVDLNTGVVRMKDGKSFYVHTDAS